MSSLPSRCSSSLTTLRHSSYLAKSAGKAIHDPPDALPDAVNSEAVFSHADAVREEMYTWAISTRALRSPPPPLHQCAVTMAHLGSVGDVAGRNHLPYPSPAARHEHNLAFDVEELVDLHLC